MPTYLPGTRIGQYEIASRPMMGGMGVVYFALDHGNDGRPVALKTFRPELLPDRAARDRFLQEGTAWIQLGNHPHIVRCYKVEYIDPTAFLVLELIAKEQNMPDASLRSWLIPGQPLPLEQALLFALQIARGMQYATEKIPGFVHRDLKPENILVGADKLPGTNVNRLRVTDFGLVKTIAGSDISVKAGNEEELKPNQVQFTRGVGTPLYMAPEQWRGEKVGAYTDVYALGCILFEMLSGKPAISGRTVPDLCRAHLLGKFNELPGELLGLVAEVVIRCLQTQPENRFSTWKELEAVIDQSYQSISGQSVLQASTGSISEHSQRVADGWSYIAMGISYLDLGKGQVAIKYFERTLDIGQMEGESDLEGAALGTLGSANYQLGDYQKAISYHEQCLAISRQNGNRYGEEASLGNMGSAYFQLGDAQQAIDYYEQQIEIARQIGDRHGEGNALSRLGIAHKDWGDLQKARLYCEQHLAIARQINDRRGEGAALGNLGNVYADLKDTQKAIGCYERHLTIAREIGDRRGEGAALGNLGSIYTDLGDVQRAIEYYEQQLLITREVGDRHGEGAALSNLAVAYKRLDISQRAQECWEQSLIIAREIGDLEIVAANSFNAALSYARQGESERALPLAEDAMNIWMQLGSPNIQQAQKLVGILQKSGTSVPEQTNPMQSAIIAFTRVDSILSMQKALIQYPLMREDYFLQVVERFIDQPFPFEQKRALKQHLKWLREITGKPKPSFFERLFSKRG